jgi:hypothetical protein
MPSQSKSSKVKGDSEGRIRRLAGDDRLLRAELVSSVLGVFNDTYLRQPLGSVSHLFQVAGPAPLAWVAAVNEFKARVGHFPRSELTIWQSPEHPGNNVLKAIQLFAQFFQGLVPDPARGTVLDVIKASGVPRRIRERRVQWLNSMLDQLNAWTKLRFVRGQIIETDLIQLNTVERCVAYTIALLIQNRDRLRDRIRVCPFTGREIANPHYFLDFRIESDGKMARGGPPIYCSPRHSNAARQHRNR